MNEKLNEMLYETSCVLIEHLITVDKRLESIEKRSSTNENVIDSNSYDISYLKTKISDLESELYNLKTDHEKLSKKYHNGKILVSSGDEKSEFTSLKDDNDTIKFEVPEHYSIGWNFDVNPFEGHKKNFRKLIQENDTYWKNVKTLRNISSEEGIDELKVIQKLNSNFYKNISQYIKNNQLSDEKVSDIWESLMEDDYLNIKKENNKFYKLNSENTFSIVYKNSHINAQFFVSSSRIIICSFLDNKAFTIQDCYYFSWKEKLIDKLNVIEII